MKDLQIIKFINVSKKYKGQTALHECNLEFKKGRIYGIVGPNGAGKTTIFKLILNLIKPTSGEVYISDNIENKKVKFGALIELPYINNNMTAFENLKFMQILGGENNHDRIYEILKMTGLGEENKKVKKFSLGMKQRLGIAMSIINNPDVLILDEPMNGLDPEGIIEIRKLLLELNDKYGVTIIVSSHILGELDKLVTDYIFIKKGELVLAEEKADIEKDMAVKGLDDFEDYYIKRIKAYE